MWELRNSRDGWAIEQQIEELGDAFRPPRWYSEKPEMGPCEDVYLSAFWDLSTERQVGMSVGPIPLSKVREFADYVGMSRGNAQVLVRMISALDSEYMRDYSEQAKKRNG